MSQHTDEERWRECAEDDRYRVSDAGDVYSVRAGRNLKPGKDSNGRLFVALGTRDGKPVIRYVHRLVLEAFVGPCPPGYMACHFDDNPANNALSNLRWDTQSANSHDAVRNGRHTNAARTHCPQGHEYTEENTIVGTQALRGGGGGPKRTCRTCYNAYQREYQRKRRAEKAHTAS